MDLLKGDIKQLYRKYLLASVTSALVMSIYTFVDTIAIGQSEGPIGAAAIAVCPPDLHRYSWRLACYAGCRVDRCYYCFDLYQQST